MILKKLIIKQDNYKKRVWQTHLSSQAKEDSELAAEGIQ